MQRRLRAVGLAVLVVLVLAAAVLARPAQTEELKTARAEVDVIAPRGMHAAPAAPIDKPLDFRDSLALVLMGGTLLGLAAAVRRTV